MQNFSPIFSRSISGRDFRIPLNPPDVEAVAARADWAYRSLPLSEAERGRLIALYAKLCKADRYLWNTVGEQPITDNRLRSASLRPSTYELASSAGVRQGERYIGFVFRCLDYIERLVGKLGAAVKCEVSTRFGDVTAHESTTIREEGKATSAGDDMPVITAMHSPHGNDVGDDI